jgi:taurine dioxygenase
MMGSAHIRATEVTPTIGAVVEGATLTKPPADSDIAAIRRLLLRYKVLFFEDQAFSPAALRDFAARFGTLYTHPIYPSLAEVPEIVVLDNHPGNPTDNDSWHTDATFLENPFMASILYAYDLPTSGGDTLWLDMRAAYLALSAPFRAFLSTLEAIHDFARGFDPEILPSKNAGKARYEQARRSYPPVTHPVIRTHPETGEDCLFVNDGFTTQIAGLSPLESARILNLLYEHIQRPEFMVRWRWKKSSLAFWDNRVTQHYAVNDYLPGRRVMHRATVIGDRPYYKAVKPVPVS